MAKVTEVVKEIAQSWKLLTKEDRSKYKEAAKRGKLLFCINFNLRQGKIRERIKIFRVSLFTSQKA